MAESNSSVATATKLGPDGLVLFKENEKHVVMYLLNNFDLNLFTNVNFTLIWTTTVNIYLNLTIHMLN